MTCKLFSEFLFTAVEAYFTFYILKHLYLVSFIKTANQKNAHYFLLQLSLLSDLQESQIIIMENDQKDLISRQDAVFSEPKTYFQLIEKVGNAGTYQRNICLIFFLNWFIASLLLMGTSFLFLNPKVNCDNFGITAANCEQHVCSIPQSQRGKFYLKQDIHSLATEFGPFHCQKLYELDALRMTLYAGTFFGYLGILFVTDNYGRKLSIVLAWSISMVGIAILSVSVNIWMACVGLFLAGIGSQSSIRISMAVFGQVVEDVMRQKYSTALQTSFGIGQITIGLVYYFIQDWRWVTVGFCLIPGIIQLLLLIFYVEETPKFIVKNNKLNAIKSLNRIGKINKGIDNLIVPEDIERVLANQVKTTHMRTPMDLIRYKSQRNNFIFMSIAFFCISFLYYGPAIIISTLSLNIFVSQVVMGATEAIAYPICYLFIERSPRKLTGYVFFGIPTVLFFILIFIQPPQGCTNCALGVFQLVTVFAARFCICYYFAIIFLFVTQIFPLPLRGTGFGMVSACGAIASTSGQFILTSLQNINFNPMILFTILSGIAGISIFFLPETLGKKLSQNIPQEQQEQRKQKQLQFDLQSNERSPRKQSKLSQMRNL